MDKKSARKCASKWDQASERVLIALWEEKMSQLRSCRKNSHILEEMVAELRSQGFSYTVVEVKTKMHNLTARYRKEKQTIGTTGGSPSEWELFKDMQALLAPFKSYHCENLVHDNINGINSIIDVSYPLPSPSATSPSSIASALPSTAASALPSPPMPADAMPPSLLIPSASPLPSSSRLAKTKKRENFCNLLKKVENNMEKIQEEIKKTSESMLAIEEEKKNILKDYVDREAEVQKALIEFLKRS